MSVRRTRAVTLGLALTLALAVAVAVVETPATGAQDPAPGGAQITAQVPSTLELSLDSRAGGLVVAQVTASIPHTQLLAASAGALLVGVGGRSPHAIRPNGRLQLTSWSHAVTRSRMVLRARIAPARARLSAALVITAAPQTP
jgi:hypothetical protein